MPAVPSPQRDVLLVQEQFWEALQAKDAIVLATILADDFVARSPGEADQTREEFITRLTSFPISVDEIVGDEIEVHLIGTTAVLTGVQVAQLRLPDGTLRTSRIILSNVFRHEDQNWCLALSYAYEMVQEH